MINGFQNEVFMDDFKSTPLLNMDQKDDIVKLNSLNDFVFLKHNRLEAWKNILCRHTNTNMHLMNKRAFDRQIENINTMFEENSSV